MKGCPLILGLMVWSLSAEAIAQSSRNEANQPLTIADLAAYRAALQPSGQPKSKAAVAVTFRELWDHPERYRGVRVRFDGRLARRFEQAKVGDFPPLAENWLFNPAGNPVCVVHPVSKGQAEPKLGDVVRFEGTYLRTISYQGGDVVRLAPLIVGSELPSLVSAAPAGSTATFGGFTLDWPIGLAAAVFVALAIGRQHLKGPRPTALERSNQESPPEFLEGERGV